MLPMLAQEASLAEQVSMNGSLTPDQVFVLLIVGIGCVTAALIVVFCVFSGLVASLQKSRMEIDLKHEMLDRGMSADEIATVVKASKPTDFLERLADRRRC
ncbi:hypothetical protein Pla123a_38300 [Posidoniimonas polymericola]|uniref:Uncharacterized protein n=1 Tax=Posidoniimonas polymericola TaxID=2528002 RepID=A0A5C5YEM3_9BACT|nr:hypothetical protein [Posidoniimonas polymericola]TWT73494.1 hypothetical protein Pla123a_38300 [Posidoniimonas polymericola]